MGGESTGNQVVDQFFDNIAKDAMASLNEGGAKKKTSKKSKRMTGGSLEDYVDNMTAVTAAARIQA